MPASANPTEICGGTPPPRCEGRPSIHAHPPLASTLSLNKRSHAMRTPTVVARHATFKPGIGSPRRSSSKCPQRRPSRLPEPALKSMHQLVGLARFCECCVNGRSARPARRARSNPSRRNRRRSVERRPPHIGMLHAPAPLSLCRPNREDAAEDRSPTLRSRLHRMANLSEPRSSTKPSHRPQGKSICATCSRLR